MSRDERRAEIEAGLPEEVAWAINYLRGIQGEINDLHREGRLKMWDRSRLHDLIRCVVDGVQGRVGLERALRGEVSTTAERSALGHLRDARGDDEADRLRADLKRWEERFDRWQNWRFFEANGSRCCECAACHAYSLLPHALADVADSGSQSC